MQQVSLYRQDRQGTSHRLESASLTNAIRKPLADLLCGSLQSEDTCQTLLHAEHVCTYRHIKLALTEVESAVSRDTRASLSL